MGSSDLSDEDLVVRARQGDQTALAALYARHAQRLARRSGRRLVGALRKREGASDLVQDTLHAALGHLDRYETTGPGSFARWLDGILARRVQDRIRRELRERRDIRREVGTASGIGAADRAPSPSSVADRAERVDRLRQAIRRTQGDDRAILALVHEQGMSFVEAGRVLGRSPDAVRKLYSRVVMRLGRAMNGQGPT